MTRLAMRAPGAHIALHRLASGIAFNYSGLPGARRRLEFTRAIGRSLDVKDGVANSNELAGVQRPQDCGRRRANKGAASSSWPSDSRTHLGRREGAPNAE